MYTHPRTVKDVKDCWFYPTMEIPGFGIVEGHWDLRGRLGDYVGGVDLNNRHVLDVGCSSGFLSFEMEKCGATVVSFDVGSAKDMDRLPFENSLYSTDRDKWEMLVNETVEGVKQSYWFTHERIGSKAKAFYGDICDLPEELGQFDVTVVGQILVHLSDPVSAFSNVARRCSGTMVITEGMLESDSPVMALCADPVKGPDWSWWHLSIGLYRSILRMAGFSIVKISDSLYDCKPMGPTRLYTIVAKRDPKLNSGSRLGAW
jgi:SAM-dependent methyltransferase